MLFLAILIIIAIIGSGFYSGAETVLISVSRVKLRFWAESKVKGARLAADFLEQPQRMIAMVLVGTNISVVTATVLAAKLVESGLQGWSDKYELLQRFAENDVVLAVLIPLVITPFLLLFGEILPKALGRHYSLKVFPVIAFPLRISYSVLLPVIWVTTRIAGLVLSMLGVKEHQGDRFFSRENVELLLRESEKEGIVDSDERGIISGVFEFGETIVREVMTPRTEMVAIERGTNVQEIGNIMHNTGYSRIPVYEGSLDKIVGMIHLFDVLQHIDGGEIKIGHIVFVPETKRCDELLREMKLKKSHMAAVVDEYGGTAGLITLEDIVEELVGDIQDEYDKDFPPIAVEKDKSLIIEGRTEIYEVNERTGLSLDEPGVETIGGFITSKLGRIPQTGEKFELDNIDIEILQSSDRRIEKVKIKLVDKM